jgi:hypothetical protein
LWAVPEYTPPDHRIIIYKTAFEAGKKVVYATPPHHNVGNIAPDENEAIMRILTKYSGAI